MPTVLFNDLIALRQRSGIGQYAAQLLRHLPEAAPDLRLIPLSRTLAGRPLTWVQAGAGGVGNPRLVKRLAHYCLDRYLGAASRLESFSLFHEPDTIPVPTGRPTVTTFHDLSVIRFPQWHPSYRVRKYERFFQGGLGRSAAFIAVSESTKTEMISLLGVTPSLIHVVPEAPRPFFRPLPAETIAAAKARHKLPESYFLHVGNLEPRKNLPTLLEAYESLGPRFRERHGLVLVGGWGWGSEALRTRLGGAIHLGYLPDEEVVALTNGAAALVCASHYEGFGLPPLEAMACGVPVISTRCGGLAETVGEAALSVSPESPASLADALRTVAESPGMRGEWGRRGLAQAARFSWEETARRTAQVYRAVLGANNC